MTTILRIDCPKLEYNPNVLQQKTIQIMMHQTIEHHLEATKSILTIHSLVTSRNYANAKIPSPGVMC